MPWLILFGLRENKSRFDNGAHQVCLGTPIREYYDNITAGLREAILERLHMKGQTKRHDPTFLIISDYNPISG